jgi:nucleotide-binding universal stress UspA family protein
MKIVFLSNALLILIELGNMKNNMEFVAPKKRHNLMKKLAVLIDFTETCDVTLEHAIGIAEKVNSEIVLVHIAPPSEVDNQSEIENSLSPYAKQIEAKGITYSYGIDFGDFMDILPPVLARMKADLVMTGTHGMVGIKQNLLGSNILKLVQRVNTPCLVVQNNSRFYSGNYDKILFPVAPHVDFTNKIKTTSDMAKIFNSMVTIYAINKSVGLLPKELRDNIEKSREWFTKEDVRHEYVEEDVKVYSVGYSKQSIKFAEDNKYNLISIMANISEENQYFGYADKEALLMNDTGIPVLCSVS